MARMSVEERRAALIDAAIVVMARDGVAHSTTRSIVAEAGMQVGMFHYCFRSKEELVMEVMRSLSERSFDAVGTVLEETDDPRELILGAVETYRKHIESDPLEHLVTYELTQYALRQPGQAEAAVAQYTHYFTGMEAFLSAVAARGGFSWSTEVSVLARYVIAVIEGITFQWLVNRDSPVAKLLLRELSTHLLRDAGLE
jgi:AcrR family transcriptional regulator